MQKRLMIDYMLRYDLLGLSLNDVKKVNDESEKTFWGHQFFCSFLPPHLGLLHKMQRSSRSIKVCFSPSDLHALIVLLTIAFKEKFCGKSVMLLPEKLLFDDFLTAFCTPLNGAKSIWQFPLLICSLGKTIKQRANTLFGAKVTE